MGKHITTIIYALIVSAMLTSILYITQYSDERFMVKGAIFSGIVLLYIVILFYLKNDQILYLLVFMSMINIPIRQLYTSSTNILIVIALFVLFVRNTFKEHTGKLFERIKSNKITLPLILVICSYTISLVLAKKGLPDHFEMYQSIIFASILAWMIIGTIREKSQIIAINYVMLVVLLINLAFSLIFLAYPGIDDLRARFLSLQVFVDEGATRLQGFSFRGEAYGEYLMICALWLFCMLVRGQLRNRRIYFWILTIVTISALIMTRLRGANGVFLLGVMFVILTANSVPFWKRTVSLAGILLAFTATLFVLQTYSSEPTLLDRFYLFSESGNNIGYIPATRYYTWVPSLQIAENHHFLGAGPSFMPYINETKWADLVHGRAASGEAATWPHNITILVLCTIGFYGLLCYAFLIYRAIKVRKNFPMLDPFLRNCYASYLICLITFLIEGQKYDGVLRHPTSSLYLIFILIALIFTCENMAIQEQTNE